MAYDFCLETKLKKEAPELHRIFTDNVLCCLNMLRKYQSLFPNYTDHTALHSLEVIAFCNELIGDNITKINVDEIFVLLMAGYLHDSGMGITEKDFEQFTRELPQVEKFRRENPNEPLDEVVRRFHNEFSGRYIYKYAPIFDFPSEEHIFAVAQASRGHRKTDLYDEKEYPYELKLCNGNVIHLPYLAALIRLADELDIAADRNIQFLYDVKNVKNARSVIEFNKHMAIKSVDFEPDHLSFKVDYSNPELAGELDELFVKLGETLDQCVDVIKDRTPFEIRQTQIKVIKL